MGDTTTIPKDPNLTPLHYAASSGQVDVIKFLCENGASVDTKDVEGGTPLFTGIGRGFPAEVARILIEFGAKVNVRFRRGLTPLHQAAALGTEEEVGLLIANGAEINALTNDGFTPLDYANHHGHQKIMELLLRHGAEKPNNIMGFVIPGGSFTGDLVSPDRKEFENAILRITNLAEQDNRAGLDELEALIAANTLYKKMPDFYEPGLRVWANPVGNQALALAELLRYANTNGLLAHVKEAQMQISSLAMLGGLDTALAAVRNRVDDKQARCIEFLYAQLNINVKYRAAKGQL